jgi:hypothetical protein
VLVKLVARRETDVAQLRQATHERVSALESR